MIILVKTSKKIKINLFEIYCSQINIRTDYINLFQSKICKEFFTDFLYIFNVIL
jgi:hypothetical protein